MKKLCLIFLIPFLVSAKVPTPVLPMINFDPSTQCDSLKNSMEEESEFGLKLMDRAEACGSNTEFKCRAKYVISVAHFIMYMEMKKLFEKECKLI